MAEDTPQFPDPSALESLSRQAAGGDVAALEQLLWAHHRRLLGFARRKIGVDWQGRIGAEDLLQEAYVAVFAGIREFVHEDADSFYRWVSRIIDHRFIDQVRHWRRKKRDVSREAAPAGSRPESMPALVERCQALAQTPSRALRRADAVGALLTCIAKLPDEYRVVVQRLYLNEEPLSRIARDFGRSEDAIRRLGSRAIEHLARCLGRASRYLSGHS